MNQHAPTIGLDHGPEHVYGQVASASSQARRHVYKHVRRHVHRHGSLLDWKHRDPAVLITYYPGHNAVGTCTVKNTVVRAHEFGTC